MHQLIKHIKQWAEDRNLINGSTPKKQMIKLMEEFGELCGGIARNNAEMIKDAIGDCFVVLVILNRQIDSAESLGDYEESLSSELYIHIQWIVYCLNDLWFHGLETEYMQSIVAKLDCIANHFRLPLKACVAHAYNQIKDRRGEIRDGVWVKAEDL